ncbi:TPA: hypothetical protein I1628_000349 [Staphylococcus pseudintermedius]|nr:hypothetical protein [Staphylococcus pseudintermedius]
MALTVEQHIQMLEMLNRVSVKKYVSHEEKKGSGQADSKDILTKIKEVLKK